MEPWEMTNESRVEQKPKRDKNQQKLLDWVKHEVESRLKNSLHNRVSILLEKEEDTTQVNPPWEIDVKIGTAQPFRLPSNKTITDIYDQEDIKGRLLILGAPGSGKTTTLLQLAEVLITRAEEDVNKPIPVLLNLSSWKYHQSIKAWIVADLKTKYGVRKDIGKQWVENAIVLPLLDGLDELTSALPKFYVEPCFKKINQFLQPETWLTPVVVCSRLEEFQQLATGIQYGAIILQLLSEQQIHDYILRTKGEELWNSIKDDRDFLELAKTPLFLNIMVISCCEGISADERQKLKSSKQRLSYLFDAYINKMLNRKYKGKQPKTEKTKHWLGWLATQFINENQTELLIENLQPYWLKVRRQKLIYQLILGLGNGLSNGLVSGLIFGLIFGLSKELTFGLIEGMIPSLIYGLIGGLICGIICGLIEGIIRIIQRITRGVYDSRIPPVESLRFSLLNFITFIPLIKFGLIYGVSLGVISLLFFCFVYGMAAGVPIGLTGGLIGVIIGVIIGRFFYDEITPAESIIFPSANLVSLLNPVLILGLIGGAIYAQFFGLVAFVFYWLILLFIGGIIYVLIHGLSISEIAIKKYPNQGIKESVRNVVKLSMIISMVVGIVVTLNQLAIQPIIGELNLDSLNEPLGLNTLLYLLLILGISYSTIQSGLPAIAHFSLRVVLWLNGYAPWNYARFLDYATERLFLQRVGGSYRFIHRRLQEHFADSYVGNRVSESESLSKKEKIIEFKPKNPKSKILPLLRKGGLIGLNVLIVLFFVDLTRRTSVFTAVSGMWYLLGGLGMVMGKWPRVRTIGKVGLMIYICKMILFLLLFGNGHFELALWVLPPLMQMTHTLLVLDMWVRMTRFQRTIFMASTGIFFLFLLCIFSGNYHWAFYAAIALFAASSYYINILPKSQ